MIAAMRATVRHGVMTRRRRAPDPLARIATRSPRGARSGGTPGVAAPNRPPERPSIPLLWLTCMPSLLGTWPERGYSLTRRPEGDEIAVSHSAVGEGCVRIHAHAGAHGCSGPRRCVVFDDRRPNADPQHARERAREVGWRRIQ